MPQTLSGAAQVDAIAGYQRRGVLNLAGVRRRVGDIAIRSCPQHVLLTHRTVGRRGQRLGASARRALGAASHGDAPHTPGSRRW